MCHVLVQRERLRRWDMCLFLFLFIVLFQISLCSSSTPVESRRYLVSSPPRKVMVYGTVPFRGSLSREDDIYGDDKRVVHTGPNPLHN
ncbi:hypothetical protein AALP_AA2G139900 [Arabis alpina]|uniref:Uncharacterized protein n=1 Tax=Arabis alpina TaxID=50452 RepID=A0A087HHB5_ARAAL|nr:hypothetical protein AALP_AA2G139900 [Arabis alpina]